MAEHTIRFKALLDSAKITGQIEELSKTRTLHIKTNGEQVVTDLTTIKDQFGQIHQTTEKLNTTTGEVSGSIKNLSTATGHLTQRFTTILGKVVKFGAA